MSLSLPSNRNPKTTLDIVVEKENLNCISKFGLSTSITQYIDLHLIFHDIYIANLIIALDIKLNLWVLNCLESYQLSLSLIVNLILELFCEEFYG